MSNPRDRRGKSFIWTLFTYLVVVTFAVPAAGIGEDCGPASRVEIDTVLRGTGLEDTEVFEVEVPAPGFLVVEATVPLDADWAPKLALIDGGCGVAASAAEKLMESFVAGLVLEVPAPGAYRFAVASQNPFGPLGPYKLVTAFTSRAELCGVASPALKTLEEEERDPDLEPFCYPKTRVPKTRVPKTRVPKTRVPKTLEEEERDPDLVTSTASFPCEKVREDDHGDVLACAGILAADMNVRGRLANSWDDDVDVFRFRVDHRRTVAIAVESGGAVSAALYDRHGHRLDLRGLYEGSLHLYVTTLSPGDHFIRLESGGGAEADYRLTLTDAGW